MPKALERKLAREARKKGFKGRRADRYIYGTMNKMGVMKGNRMTPKGRAMETKRMVAS